MRRKLLDALRQLGLAFAAVAMATMLTILLWRFHFAGLPRFAPFLYLVVILACSWRGGYIAGIASIFFTLCVNSLLTRRTLDLTQVDPYRASLLLLLSVATSWIQAHSRHVEEELRARVEQKTTELKAAVDNLEREIQERKVAEEEVLRLNSILERRVDERTRQLEVSNQELESFSYSVSHDLRAPLRSIDGFSRILLTNCFPKLDEEERSLFQRILANTGRMNELIDDLLNLARVTRTVMHTARVDLSAIADHIAGELSKEHPNSLTRFIIEPGITACADTGLAGVVLHNLLENAWKFSSQTPGPCVEFGAATVDGEQVLFVKDNGAGFDPAYMSKLFTPFQRLHRQEEFPGTGIGLATVSRIVHRHGGWIRAESQLGKGATFFFTLPTSATFGAAPLKPAATLPRHLPEDPKPPIPRAESPNSASTQSTLT
jgi:signal transduction histidine kinase